VTDTICEAFGGVYVSSLGDYQFVERRANNAIIVWWNPVHHVFALDLKETLKLDTSTRTSIRHLFDQICQVSVYLTLPDSMLPHSRSDAMDFCIPHCGDSTFLFTVLLALRTLHLIDLFADIPVRVLPL
jgi:hypothetical protein